MSALDVFEYAGQQLRTVIVDGEPWFVAVDVCAALDLGNPSAAVARLDSDEVTLISNEGRPLNGVNEAGLFSLILGSRKPEARDFKRWVTHEVLPSIRQTGSYSTTPALTGAELIATALIEAQKVIEQAHQQVQELTPRAEAWDDLAGAGGDYAVADAAKILARAGILTGPQRLFEQLAELGWIFRGPQGRWKARQTVVDAGYLDHKVMQRRDPSTGETLVAPPQVRVTIRGLERLRIRLGSALALVEAVSA